MTAADRLLELLKAQSFRRAEPGKLFTLASGEKSDYFIDGKMTAVSPEGATLIGQVLYDRTKDDNLDAIGGLQVGAVPLVTAAVMTYHAHGRAVEGFWAREAVKDHGTQKLIEGNLRKGDRVAIVDDVFTKGGSALKAAQAAREYGCEVVCVIALVDRLRGARKLFEENGITDYRAVFTIKDFGVDVPGSPELASV
jgi:orotate phosphoribosyltransferase